MQKSESSDQQNCNKTLLNNQKLITWVAKQFLLSPSIELEDLFQEGCIGVLEACESFNPEKGKFSTYAIPYIKKYMIEYINKLNVVVVPNQVNNVQINNIDDYLYHLSENPEKNNNSFSEDIKHLLNKEEQIVLSYIKGDVLKHDLINKHEISTRQFHYIKNKMVDKLKTHLL